MTKKNDVSRRDLLATGLVGAGSLAISQLGCGALPRERTFEDVDIDTVTFGLDAFVTAPVQQDWKWCNRCASIFFNGNGSSTCPNPSQPNGFHDSGGSTNYVFIHAATGAPPGQTGWKWCRNCQSLFFGASPGVCPGFAGGHSSVGSADYIVQFEGQASGQVGWRWCKNCSVLFHSGSPNRRCAANSGNHDSSASGNYVVMMGAGFSTIIGSVPTTAGGVPFTAVHAALLPVSPPKILAFSGDNFESSKIQNDVDNTWVFNFDNANVRTQILNAPGGTEFKKDGTTFSVKHDMFCSGHAFLVDGSLLVAGGTLQDRTDFNGSDPDANFHLHHWGGLRQASIFRPSSSNWVGTGSMLILDPPVGSPAGTSNLGNGGRWYPTLLAMGDGQILAMGGHTLKTDFRHSNTVVERYNPLSLTWNKVADEPPRTVAAVSGAMVDPFLPNGANGVGFPEQYPRIHLLPNGTVLCARLSDKAPGATWNLDRTFRFDPSTGAWTDLCAAVPDNPPNGAAGYSPGYFFLDTTVLLPLRAPNYRAMVLHVGNRDAKFLDLGDNGATNPGGWTSTGSRKLLSVSNPALRPMRRHCNAVLTPDGKVLVIGGTDQNDFSDAMAAVLQVEQFDPAFNSWTTLGQIIKPREYHATALLCPDGRIWIGGSSPPKGGDRIPEVELYTPPYLERGPQPVITSVSDTVFARNGVRSVNTPDTSMIRAVTLVRVSSVTHGFSSDQRCVELTFQRASGTQLWVNTPASSNILPPGPYMLFIIDHFGVPSVGKFVSLPL